MRSFIFPLLLFLGQMVFAQHCPWDCSGLLMLKTDLTPAEFKKLDPLLVNADDQPVIDTIYGTGVDSHDTSRFLYFDDFVEYRTARTRLHHWYAFDTAYRFARDHFLVRYNFCHYKNLEIFLRYKDPEHGEYHYMEISTRHRIHLHDFNQEIRQQKALAEIPGLQPLVMVVDRSAWKLPPK